MKVNAGDFGSSVPKVEPDDLEGDYAMLTIAGFSQGEVEDTEKAEGVRNVATLTFEETGDKVVYLNKGQVETLIEQFGDNTDNWTGKVCPVEKHIAEYRGRQYPKVRVAPSEEWAKLFKDAGVSFKGKRAAVSSAPKAGSVKKGGKKK